MNLMDYSIFSISVRKVVGRAMAAIEPLTPVQYTYAMHTRDLRNVTPASFIFDNKGRRLAGRFSPADVTDGFPSPAIWAFFLPMLTLSMIGTVLLAIAAFFGTWIPLAGYGAAYSFAVSHGGGVIGSAFTALGSAYVGIFLWSLFSALPLAGIAYLAYLLIAETEPTRSAHHTFWATVLMVLGFVVIVPIVGPAFGAFLCLVAPWLTFYSSIKGAEMARHKALMESSEEAKGMTALPDAGKHEELRGQQAAAALRDLIPGANKPAPLHIFGIDTGWVREETSNPISADKGAALGFSLCEDLSRHAFVFGGTGSGKTSGWMKPLARAWKEHDMGGGLYLDAKAGALPMELHAAGLIDLLVRPGSADGVKLNLMASMDPAFFAKAIADVFTKDQKGSVFNDAARGYVFTAAMLVAFAADKKIAGAELTFGYLNTFRSNHAERERVLNLIISDHEDAIMADSALRTAFDHWATSYPSLPNETRGSVDFTLDTFFMEVVANQTIASTVCAGGEDIAELICRGKRVGIVMSEADGMGGLVVLALIKAAVFARMKKRAQDPDWRAKGERDVLVMVDECASLIDDLDAHAASVMRSLGVRMAYCCQSYDQVVAKLGGTSQANLFLDNFKTIGTLSATGAGDKSVAVGTYAYVEGRLGKLWRLDKDNTTIEAVSLDKGVQKTRSSGLQNRNQGALAAKISSITTMIAETKKMFSLNSSSLGERKDKMREAGSDSYQLRLMPAVTADEMTSLCEGVHRFVGRIERGGVGRVVVANIRPGAADEANQRQVMYIQERLAENKKAQARIQNKPATASVANA